ncbi:iron(III) transport system permease protein [Hydrogenispora ethanolica]|uniref:Iron(III) transport system permease protein n=1 Tax=Hydrogenispora ethanolica TaxID=1082276 RepID=A0A4V2QDR0_HYDET|nr:iron ABC transporter permease [Hydrogenispora ethanolica]TCL65317.1 iron(III) transport system permease protein [Hydrogenispora ethanolica]
MSVNQPVTANSWQRFCRGRKLDFWTVVIGIAFVTLALFLVFPFSSTVLRSFMTESGKLSFEHYIDFFRLPYYYRTLFNSLSVCVTATILASLVGLPLAYITARFNVWGKKLINLLIIMSLLSPPFIGAYSWILLLGRSGLITKWVQTFGIELPSIYGWLGIVLVFTLKFTPFVYLYVSGALGSIDRSLEEAAANLGMPSWKRLLTITFPLILPTILSAALMVFMSSLADFGTPMLIGEGFKVLPVLVYEEYMSEIGGNAAVASTLSVLIILCATAVLLLQKWVVGRKNYTMSALRPPEVKALSAGPRLLLTACCFAFSLVAVLPQIVVVVTSFLKTNGPIFVPGFSLESYTTIMYKLSRNIANTYAYATIAIIIMVLGGLLLAYVIVRRKSKATNLLDILIMFPYVVPGAVLGITLLVAFNKPPLLLSGTWMIMVVAYVIRKLPYTIRSSAAILYQIDPSIEEASINLGVSPMKTFFKTTARLMAPGVFSGAILSWVTTINELSSSVMLYTGRTATISVAIYTEVVRNSFGTAAALASILTFTTIISLLIFYRFSGGKEISL